MCCHKFLFLFVFLLSIIKSLPGSNPGDFNSINWQRSLSVNDTLKENQILYNGRVWRNSYYYVKEDQFFLSKEFLKGSITIGGKTYENLNVRYDIYADQIMTPSNQGPILQVNKEMVDSFSLIFQDEKWRFINIREDSLNVLNGYLNVLYRGKCDLYVKYKKEIALLAVDKKYDKFYLVQRIYLVKDNIVYPVSGKQNLLNLFGEDKQQVKNYIKKNRLVLSRKRPESFVPVIQFYDNLIY